MHPATALPVADICAERAQPRRTGPAGHSSKNHSRHWAEIASPAETGKVWTQPQPVELHWTVSGCSGSEEADKARWPMLAFAEDQVQLNIVKTSQNFPETGPPAHIPVDNLTYMTALAEDCCEKTEQAKGLLRGAKFNLCFYLQNKKRWDYPSACLHQQHLLSEESIDSETQPVISSHSSRAHALCSQRSCVRVQACKNWGGWLNRGMRTKTLRQNTPTHLKIPLFQQGETTLT